LEEGKPFKKRKKISGKQAIGSLGIAMLETNKYKEQLANLSISKKRK